MSKALLPVGRRRALWGSAAGLVVLGLLAWWLLPLGESSPSGRVAFSTGTRNGVYQRYGELLDDELADRLPRLDIELRDSEGSQENIARVATGEADFAIAAADAVQQYVADDRPGADLLRACARLYDDYVHVVVADTSQVKSVRDLKGLRVAIGPGGSGVRLIAEHVLKAAGLDPRTDIEQSSEGIGAMPRLLEEGRIDAFFWSGGLPTRAVTSLSQEFGIRLVPIEESLVEEMHEQGGASGYYRASVMPADAYREAQKGQSVPTLAVANLLITREDTDAGLTEDVTRTVIDSRGTIGREVHAAQLVDLRTAVYTDPLDLHEGARRYYRSVKP
ncbi:TAXI family TRAP transporter solute-binding subunit [Streptomyces minutiscleroticus]|uniref:TAXI family TRAP transporter solute-binding subunit n=1 Tax=Streptomyces minutiscleroticus TaxID=68238 RepID=UPI0033182ADE